MSLGLHAKCLQRLREKIAERLPKIEVKNRLFPESWSLMLHSAGKILPQDKEFKNAIEQYVSETPVHDFVYETLSRELYESEEYDSESPSLPLTALHGYADPHVTAERLVRDFDSLPWRYSLLIELTNEFGAQFARTLKEFALSDSARLVTPNENFAKVFPTESTIEARNRRLGYLTYWPEAKPAPTHISGLLMQNYFAPVPDKAYSFFQLNVSGFIGFYGETGPLRDATSILKAFLGLGIALRLLALDYSYRSMPSRAKFIIHRQVSDSWMIEGTHELDAALSDRLQDLVVNDLAGQLRTEEEKASWIEKQLSSIGRVFKNTPQSEKVMLASQWLFDSYCGSNELLSFVQATVAIEILLGDKADSDLMGLERLLSNRCAYLIGHTRKQREEILDQFREIYDVRSKIVHRGKSRLTADERELFSKLQWMCRRVIQEEVIRLERDIQEAEADALTSMLRLSRRRKS